MLIHEKNSRIVNKFLGILGIQWLLVELLSFLLVIVAYVTVARTLAYDYFYFARKA